MVTRRFVLGAAATAAGLAAFPGEATAAPKATSANGWPIAKATVAGYVVEGARASVTLHRDAAAVLLHVARRWHYEIAPLDTGEGTITGWRTDPAVGAEFETNYLSGTAIALYPRAYPLGGSEKLWPHQEAIVRDILLDCEGIVAWGGDFTAVKVSHFHLAVAPADRTLAAVRSRLDPAYQPASRLQSAGAVTDPGVPARRTRAKQLPRRRS